MEREADHSSPSSAESRMRGTIPSLPQYVFMAWCSFKAQGQFYVYLFPLKQPEREADHFPPASVDVKNAWSYTTTSTIRLRGSVLNEVILC
jgi:hypothetical protein